MDQFAGVILALLKVLHITGFSALSDQCTPKGQRVSLCLGLSLLRSLVGAKSV